MPRATAAERAMRLLAILHVLEPDAEISLDAIADTLGITPAEAAEDLVILSLCGIWPYTPDALVPVLVEDHVAIVFGELPALERTVRLSESQVHAVLAALQAAGLRADDPLCRKLMAAAPVDSMDAGRFERALASAKSEGADDVLKAASLAIEQRRVLRLAYQGMAEQEPRERVVEPVALLSERGHWYLEAYARDAGALRTFRSDRVRACEALEERFSRHQLAPTGAAIVTDGLPLAVVRLAPGEEITTRDWPGMRIVSSGPEGTLIEVPYAGTAWISRQVVARLGRAELLEPAELREAIRELAEAGSLR